MKENLLKRKEEMGTEALDGENVQATSYRRNEMKVIIQKEMLETRGPTRN